MAKAGVAGDQEVEVVHIDAKVGIRATIAVETEKEMVGTELVVLVPPVGVLVPVELQALAMAHLSMALAPVLLPVRL